jgi:predicted  nucleic acid-binding Zn-ribbon protein
MAEEKKKKTVEDLVKQIEDFENTIRGLEANVAVLKKRLKENQEKYGSDISSWPKEAK